MMDYFSSVFHEEVIFLDEERQFTKPLNMRTASDMRNGKEALKTFDDHASNADDRETRFKERKEFDKQAYDNATLKAIKHAKKQDKQDDTYQGNITHAANKLYSNQKKAERKAHHESFNFDII